MGWLDTLFTNDRLDPQDGAGGPGRGWLGGLFPAPAAAEQASVPQASAAPGGNVVQAPGLLDRLTAGATNLTTGGNPLAGLLNAVNGLATGQRTDAAGATLAQQGAVRQALMAAGVPDAVAAAAAMNPEVLKAVAPQLYTRPQPQKLRDALGNERIVFANPDRQTVTDPAGPDAASRGTSLLAPGVTRYDPNLPAEPYLAQFSPQMQAAIKAHVASGVGQRDPTRIAIANAARVLAQRYADKVHAAPSGAMPAPKSAQSASVD
jgi:hypothetical protein